MEVAPPPKKDINKHVFLLNPDGLVLNLLFDLPGQILYKIFISKLGFLLIGHFNSHYGYP